MKQNFVKLLTFFSFVILQTLNNAEKQIMYFQFNVIPLITDNNVLKTMLLSSLSITNEVQEYIIYITK